MSPYTVSRRRKAAAEEPQQGDGQDINRDHRGQNRGPSPGEVQPQPAPATGWLRSEGTHQGGSGNCEPLNDPIPF
jgi:hypothetical protein